MESASARVERDIAKEDTAFELAAIQAIIEAVVEHGPALSGPGWNYLLSRIPAMEAEVGQHLSPPR